MPVENAHVKQDSPPAGTLEAYRPLRSEYSFCCPHLWRGGGGGGYPTSGTPGPDLAWGGIPHPCWGGGGGGVPHLGYHPRVLTWPGGGIPHLR